MQRILFIIGAAIILISTIKFILSLYRRKQDKNDPVHISPFCSSLCIVIAIVSKFASLLVGLTSAGTMAHYIMFECVSALSAVMSFSMSSFEISYNADGFTYTSFFGIKQHYTYDEIKGYKGRLCKSDITLLVKNRTILIDKHAINLLSFFKYAGKRYKLANGGHAMKKITSTTDRIFGKHINEADNFLLFGILFILISAAVLITTIVMGYSPINGSNSEHVKVSFSSYETADGKALLYAYPSEDISSSVFVIEHPENAGIWDAELRFAADGTECDVWAKLYEPDDEEAYYKIRRMTCKGIELYSFSDAEQNKNDTFFPIIMICTVLTLAAFANLGLGTIAARNPKKHPFFVKLFFSKGQLSLTDKTHK